MNVVILCDGTPPPVSMIKEELAAQKNSLFIAADGGALVAEKMSLQPDIIIGDLDSYTPDGTERAEVIRVPDQESNDLEKALHEAVKRGAKTAVVFGATGKQLDHTLKNLSVLLRFHPILDDIRFKDRYSEMEIITSPFKRTMEPGTTISLFPLSGTVHGITTRGLKYPLYGEELKNGSRDGDSNVVTESVVEIDYEEGDLLLFTILKPSEV